MSTPQGFLRLRKVIAPSGSIPVSRSTWYARVATGEFPPPVKVGRMSLWAVEEIDALIARLKQDDKRHCEDSAYGYRPRRSAVDAVKETHRLICRGYPHAIVDAAAP
jgi:prophage regulatory protein